MTANTFDTLTAARELENTGLDRRQAEAIAQEIRNGQGELVTKDHFTAALADLENRLVKWAVALAGAVVIILGLLIRWPF